MIYRLILAVVLLQAPSFNAASIKPSSPDANGSDTDSDSGSLRMRNVTLKRCIRIAYGIPEDRILNGPKWMDDKHYDIDARADHPASSEETSAMLQSLLADRFHLLLHHETRALSGYAMTVAKGGLKGKPAPSDTPLNQTNTTHGGRGRMDASALSMESLAKRLTTLLGAPVLNATDLPGYFDFSLRWNPDETQASDAPSMFTALQEQVGVKLEARKVPTDLLVIDRAELPTEN